MGGPGVSAGDPATRIVPLISVENARDLGGLATVDGRRVVRGVFVRSAALDGLAAADRESLERLGFVTALDLRSDLERAERPSRWPPERVVAAPLADDGQTADVVARIMRGDLLGDELEAFWELAVATFALRFVPSIRRVFEVFAEASPGNGVMFSCRGGKDRTGVVAMLLLEALGVRRDEIMADFMATNAQMSTEVRAELVAAEFARLKGTPVAPADVFPFAGVREGWLEGAYRLVEARFGSVQHYLVEEIGVDLGAFRERFLEPPAADEGSADREREAVEARLRVTYPDTEFIGRASLDPIEVVDPSPGWPGVFAEWQARLAAALGGTARRIEHIGSTAVPGLVAKPIIDVLVSVADLDEESRYVPAIESLGPALRLREPGHRYFRAPGERRVVHVHVCEAGGRWERDHLLFRDYLRAVPEAVAAYAGLKRRLAERFRHDRTAYTEGKTEFITGLLTDAERWAAATGWQVGGT